MASIWSIKKNKSKGRVYLVGAGPGDPNLLTIKAYQLLKKADVILYDALVSTEILSLISDKAELIAVGKRAGEHSASQSEINQLLVTKACMHKTVIRLKGGDPFIFGRGGEELEALKQANIDFEVVPGITAASGAAAYAGIPLSHRQHAQSISFITGHCKMSPHQIKWQLYADASQTLVIYMGIINANIISKELIKVGRDPSVSTAIIANASLPNQKVFMGTLANLSELASNPELEMPALIIIGDVVKHTENLNWFAKQQQELAKTGLSKALMKEMVY